MVLNISNKPASMRYSSWSFPICGALAMEDQSLCNSRYVIAKIIHDPRHADRRAYSRSGCNMEGYHHRYYCRYPMYLDPLIFRKFISYFQGSKNFSLKPPKPIEADAMFPTFAGAKDFGKRRRIFADNSITAIIIVDSTHMAETCASLSYPPNCCRHRFGTVIWSITSRWVEWVAGYPYVVVFFAVPMPSTERRGCRRTVVGKMSCHSMYSLSFQFLR